MSETDGSIMRGIPSLGWRADGARLERIGLSYQSIAVCRAPDGDMFMEIRDGTKAIWVGYLPPDVATHLASLLAPPAPWPEAAP